MVNLKNSVVAHALIKGEYIDLNILVGYFYLLNYNFKWGIKFMFTF